MFYKRLCDQWEYESGDAIAKLERQQGHELTEAQKAISTNISEELTGAMQVVGEERQRV